MDSIADAIKQPFTWGLGLGLLFFFWSAWSHLKTRAELRRYRKHLSDKLELEARQYELIRKEKESLAKENENLRLRVGQMSEKPDQKVLRDLEILARAEKRMIMQAPGFAAAWEQAKAAAADEVIGEDQGRSLPRRLFNRLFGTGTARPDDAARMIAENAAPAASPGSDNGARDSATAPEDAFTSGAPAPGAPRPPATGPVPPASAPGSGA